MGHLHGTGRTTISISPPIFWMPPRRRIVPLPLPGIRIEFDDKHKRYIPLRYHGCGYAIFMCVYKYINWPTWNHDS